MAVDTTVQVTLPQMGESVTEGTVLEWHKQEGDRVEADEVLVEVSTDKVDAEVPAPTSGTVTKIHAAEGDTVEVGGILAEIATGNGGTPASAQGNGGTSAPATDSTEAEPAADAERTAAEPAADSAPAPSADGADGAAPGQTIDIVTPSAGESVTEGTLVAWHVAAGDHVDDGQAVADISTDKIDVELPAPAAGTITEIVADEGDTVTVGQVIARMTTSDGASAAATPAPAPETARDGDGARDAGAGNGATAAPAVPEDAKVSPVAARIAAAEGHDHPRVNGTGPHGRITQAEVLATIANGGAAAPVEAPAEPAAPGATPQPLRGGAGMLARYMDESRSIPTATSFRTITVTTMDGRRKQLKDAGERVSFTHLIAYAIALSAQHDAPVMAHHFADIDGRPHRIDDGQVNLGIAVDVRSSATPGACRSASSRPPSTGSSRRRARTR